LLYFAEGAPIGYIWWAMPTRLREAGVPVEEVAALIAMLALPWAFKFLWAPAVDRLRGAKWGYRAWITVAQVAMGLTLLPLSALPIQDSMGIITWLLLAHAVSAATQDVAIDALAISSVPEHDRARTTGWMQAGMLVGRATFGGLALAAEQWIGAPAVIFVLVGCIWFTIAVVWLFPNSGAMDAPRRPDAPPLSVTIPRALRQRTLWVGLGIALTAGAGFEAVGGLMGPFLLDHNATQSAIGAFFALPVVLCMIVGGLAGGTLADHLSHRRLIGLSVIAILVCIAVIVAGSALLQFEGWRLMALAAPLYLCIGCLVASSYALFMDLSDPAIGGTQFSAFMGATNLCEVWAIALAGFIVARSGYGVAFLAVASISLVALPLLAFSRPNPRVSERVPDAS
jgi:MFS family permease